MSPILNIKVQRGWLIERRENPHPRHANAAHAMLPETETHNSKCVRLIAELQDEATLIQTKGEKANPKPGGML